MAYSDGRTMGSFTTVLRVIRIALRRDQQALLDRGSASGARRIEIAPPGALAAPG
jgi:hypothetical protein